MGADSFLLQQRDLKITAPADLKIVTKRQPTAAELKAMLFGWRVVKHLKSNAILYAGADRTLGTGAGQMSRVDSSRIAVWKAGEAKLSLKGSVVCSDAFFPFPDGLIAAAEAGATAAIQPGGSVQDAEVIAAADERGMAMAFTGTRHFRPLNGCQAQFIAATSKSGELAEGDERQQRPDKIFTEAQAALPGGGEPELDFHRTDRDGVTVAKNGVSEPARR